ncbi:hypothetical protein GCM10022206_30720 [Streptomyces chiangmaiensis]
MSDGETIRSFSRGREARASVTTRQCTFVDAAHTRSAVTGWWLGFGVITLAASLNAAGEAAARGGAGPPSIVWAHRAHVSTTHRNCWAPVRYPGRS